MIMKDVSGEIQKSTADQEDYIGENHVSHAISTPLVEGAFDLSDEDKIEKIKFHFKSIMETLGMDMSDDSLQGTPNRVAKMYVKEIFKGLNPKDAPKASTFENKYQYNRMLVEKNIKVKSTCEHHFLPMVGSAHIAYISTGKVIGLSKMNRIVDHFSRRPQVQERLTRQILQAMKEALNTDHVAVIVEAKHMCVTTRGIEHEHSSTVTVEYSGDFEKEDVKQEFLKFVGTDLMSYHG